MDWSSDNFDNLRDDLDDIADTQQPILRPQPTGRFSPSGSSEETLVHFTSSTTQEVVESHTSSRNGVIQETFHSVTRHESLDVSTGNLMQFSYAELATEEPTSGRGGEMDAGDTVYLEANSGVDGNTDRLNVSQDNDSTMEYYSADAGEEDAVSGRGGVELVPDSQLSRNQADLNGSNSKMQPESASAVEERVPNSQPEEESTHNSDDMFAEFEKAKASVRAASGQTDSDQPEDHEPELGALENFPEENGVADEIYPRDVSQSSQRDEDASLISEDDGNDDVPLGEADAEVVGERGRVVEEDEMEIPEPRTRSRVTDSNSTEGDVREVLDGLMDEVAGPLPGMEDDEYSPSTAGGEEVFALAMSSCDVPYIKQEPGVDHTRRSESVESFQSTALVDPSYGASTSRRHSPPMEADRLLRNIGLRTLGEPGREGSEEIEAPHFNGNRQVAFNLRGRSGKKTGAAGVKNAGITKKAPSPRFSTVLKRVCVFTKCPDYMKSPQHVFAFPDEKKKPLVRRKWVDEVNGAKGVTKKLLLGNVAKNPHYGLCIRHFNRQTDFKAGEKLVLLENVIPNFTGPAAAGGAAPQKSQFARKTVVPVVRIAPAPDAKAAKTPKEMRLPVEPPISEGEEYPDDSDRDADWEKTADAKKKKKVRRNKKRGRNADSTSESESPSSEEDELPLPALILRPPEKTGLKIGPVPIQPKIIIPTKRKLANEPVMVILPGPGHKATASGKATISEVGKMIPGASTTTGQLKGRGRPPAGPNGQVMVSLQDPLRPTGGPLTAASKGSVRLVLQKITPLPPPPIILPPKIIMKSPARAPTAHKQAQVEEDDLDADSSDEEIQDIMKEAQDQILELQFDLEEARMDLTAEKKKVEHLETRVAAWIRAYFCASTLEAERLEMMDKLGTYYLDHARRVDEENKAMKGELELFRNNYARSQKETESYRAQIIDLQGASSREIERIQTAKVKNEKDAQETITTLRRQLADAVVLADSAKRKQATAEEDVKRLSAAANQALAASPNRSHYMQQLQYQQQQLQQQPPSYTPPPPAPAATPTPKTRSRAPRGKAATPTVQYEAPVAGPSQTVEAPKKRGRKTKEPATAEPPGKRARESSVDRATAALLADSSTSSWLTTALNSGDQSRYQSNHAQLEYFAQQQQQQQQLHHQPTSVILQQSPQRGRAVQDTQTFNLHSYSQGRSGNSSAFIQPTTHHLPDSDFFQTQPTVIASAGFSLPSGYGQSGQMDGSPAGRTRSHNHLQGQPQPTPSTFHRHFQGRQY